MSTRFIDLDLLQIGLLISICIGVLATGMEAALQLPLVGQKPAAKNERSIYSTLKTEFIASSKMKCPKSKIFVDIYWVGLVGQIL